MNSLGIKIPLLPGAVPENLPPIISGTNRGAETPYKAPGLRHASSTLLGNNTPVISPSNVTVSVAPTSSMSVAPALSVPVPVPVAPGQASLWTRMYYGDATKRFISAFERKDEKEMERAIRQGADIKKARPYEYMEPLAWAAGEGYLGIVRFLLDRGANMKDKYAALQAACFNGSKEKQSVEIARLLIDRGVDVSKHVTFFITATRTMYLDLMSLLLERGADVNAASTDDGETALMEACQYGRAEVVRFLLERGADVNAVKKDGFTPLMLACSNGHYSQWQRQYCYVARLLLEKGADVNAQQGNGKHISTPGWTSLMWACARGHLDLVSLLLEKGADVNNVAGDGQTALILTLLFKETGWGVREARELIRLQKLSEGVVAVFEEEEDTIGVKTAIVRLLLAKGVTVNNVTSHGLTALEVAATFYSTSMYTATLDDFERVKLLCSAGAEPLKRKVLIYDKEIEEFLKTSCHKRAHPNFLHEGGKFSRRKRA